MMVEQPKSKKQGIDRDIAFLIMLYVMLAALAFAGYWFIRAYTAEGRLQNNVCEIQR